VIRPAITGAVLQSLRTTKASQAVPAATSRNAHVAICRGVNRPYSRTIRMAVKNTVSMNGIIAIDVWKAVFPWTI
jgi:hypothetical protein